MVTSPKNCQNIFHNFLKIGSLKNACMELNENILFIALINYLSNDSKNIKIRLLGEAAYFFFRKHENTLKSMDFYKRDEYFCPPSVFRTCENNVAGTP